MPCLFFAPGGIVRSGFEATLIPGSIAEPMGAFYHDGNNSLGCFIGLIAGNSSKKEFRTDLNSFNIYYASQEEMEALTQNES